MSEWKEYKLGDILKIKHGFSFSGKYISEKKSKNILITPGNFKIGGGFKSDKLKYFQTNDFPSEYILEEGDIIVTMTDLSKDSDTLGYSAKVPKEENAVYLHNQRIGLLQFKKNIDFSPDFIYWLLRTREYQNYIVGSASGTSIMHTSPSRIEDYECKLPPLLEQLAIASVLSSLDDKIDLLHRQNATLEKMAETLFRQWFVEEAKEEWKIGCVSDYALHFKDSIHPQKNKLTLYFHYSIPSFDNGKDPIREYGEKIQSNKYGIPKYCILFSKLNPHKDKRVWLLQNEVGENSICSTEFQVVLPKKKHYLFFLYGWLTHNENYNEIASGVGGTSGSHQRIDPRTIFQFQCPLIPDNVLELFEKQVESLFNKQITNEQQIRTLTSLRNTLLSKLMSGEVQINN